MQYRGFEITTVSVRSKNRTYHIAKIGVMGPYLGRDLRFKSRCHFDFERVAWRSEDKLKQAIDKVCSMLELD